MTYDRDADIYRGCERAIEPAAKALDIAVARSQVRQELTIDDADLSFWIRAAEKLAEQHCGRTLMATRWCLTLDRFPCKPWRLANGPILGIQGVSYMDDAGDWQALDEEVYTLAGRDFALAYGQSWPTTRCQLGAVKIYYNAGDAAGITADKDTDILTIKGGIWRALAVGDVVRLSNSGGTLPAPLTVDTDYYVQSLPAAGQFKLSQTDGGAAIDITNVGTGTHYIGSVPEDVLAWMRLRIGGLYRDREDSGRAGELQPLPYVDRMLDGARLWG